MFFADLMLLGVFLHTFREWVKRNLRWSRKDDTNPDVRRALMRVASRLGAKEASRTRDKGVENGPKMWKRKGYDARCEPRGATDKTTDPLGKSAQDIRRLGVWLLSAEEGPRRRIAPGRRQEHSWLQSLYREPLQSAGVQSPGMSLVETGVEQVPQLA